ncbi:lysozyme [Caenorhabditis elegans]|uniref:lysozyme n=1 Tax=Caenorhabditis elegans TaxID=6239 RepID=O76359_CAEEL|nr:lysozyme [Caenorhabditis elegans]CCD65534.1 lysozyme [Caenorhabditis elegans]|eukprot:NP_500208.2 Invertebrate LYSozyme [Caenorhabditis elegans]
MMNYYHRYKSQCNGLGMSECENYYHRYKSQCDGLGMGECEVFARNHNGGPTGCRNPGTLEYWQSIQKCCGGSC